MENKRSHVRIWCENLETDERKMLTLSLRVSSGSFGGHRRLQACLRPGLLTANTFKLSDSHVGPMGSHCEVFCTLVQQRPLVRALQQQQTTTNPE